MSSRTEHESGFTLVELLVVILIIGVLAAIAVPAFLNQRKAANDAALRADMRTVAGQVQSYITQNPYDKDIQPEEIASYMGNHRLSPGTNVLIFGGYDNWCLVGANYYGNKNSFDTPDTGSAVPGGVLYDSYNGGFQPEGADIWAGECIIGSNTHPDLDSASDNDEVKNINVFLATAD